MSTLLETYGCLISLACIGGLIAGIVSVWGWFCLRVASDDDDKHGRG